MIHSCLLFLAVASLTSVVAAQETDERIDRNARVINLALLTLPDHLVSDLPESERAGLLKLFSHEDRGRMDYGNGFVDYYRDGAAVHDEPSGSCRFWMKVFRSDDGAPFLFVHNYHRESSKDMTAFFWCDQYGRFTDVTSDYLPKEVDLSLHLRPRRESDTIRIAEYEEYRLQDERDKGKIYYRVGPQMAELIWTGKGFDLRKTEKTEIPHLDRLKKKP